MLDDGKQVNRRDFSDTETTTLVINKRRFRDEEYASTIEAFVSAKKKLKKHLRAIKKLAK